MSVRFKVFGESGPQSLEELFGEAAAFASELKPERLISISQVMLARTMQPAVLVTVWYWDGD